MALPPSTRFILATGAAHEPVTQFMALVGAAPAARGFRRRLWFGLCHTPAKIGSSPMTDDDRRAMLAKIHIARLTRQRSKNNLRFCLSAEKSTLIEALKAWAERENAEAP